jgi:hypothetical protein
VRVEKYVNINETRSEMKKHKKKKNDLPLLIQLCCVRGLPGAPERQLLVHFGKVIVHEVDTLAQRVYTLHHRHRETDRQNDLVPTHATRSHSHLEIESEDDSNLADFLNHEHETLDLLGRVESGVEPLAARRDAAHVQATASPVRPVLGFRATVRTQTLLKRRMDVAHELASICAAAAKQTLFFASGAGRCRFFLLDSRNRARRLRLGDDAKRTGRR